MAGEPRRAAANGLYPMFEGDVVCAARPRTTIARDRLGEYEIRGYVARYSFCGTRVIVEMKPGGRIELRSPHPGRNEAHEPSDAMAADFHELHESVDADTHLVLDGVLIRGDRFVAVDLLVHADTHFVGMSRLERYLLLDQIMGQQEERELQTGGSIAIYVRDHLWMAETFVHGLERELERILDVDEVDGLVLERPDAPLRRSSTSDDDSSAIVLARST